MRRRLSAYTGIRLGQCSSKGVGAKVNSFEVDIELKVRGRL
jgi:hypothetical protein